MGLRATSMCQSTWPSTATVGSGNRRWRSRWRSISMGSGTMSSPRNNSRVRSLAAAPALRAAPGPARSLERIRTPASSGACWSSPSTTTIVSKPDRVWACRPSRARARMSHRSRVGMMTVRADGASSAIEVVSRVLARPKVLDDPCRATKGQGIGRDRPRHNGVGTDEGSLPDVGDDGALGHDGNVIPDMNGPVVVTLSDDRQVRIAEPVAAVHDHRRLRDEAAAPDLDRRRALDKRIGCEHGAVPDLDPSIVRNLADEASPEVDTGTDDQRPVVWDVQLKAGPEPNRA